MTANQTAKRIARTAIPSEYRWRVRRWAARTAHFGMARFCVCCGSYLREFTTFGDPPRPQARCPVCGALERHRLVAMFLREHERLFRDMRRVLHVAPEPPLVRFFSARANERYVSLDLKADGVMVQADLTGMPFAEHAFDFIYCSHVLEHVPNDRAAMAELHRILRPEGIAVIQVPVLREVTFEDPSITDPQTRRRLFGQPDHVRIYGRDVEDRLADARFAVSVEHPQRDLDEAIVARCGLSRQDDVYFCRKCVPRTVRRRDCARH